MDWCRLSTRYYHDGALLRAGEAAEVLFLRCIAYSGAEESRGRVPKHALPMLTPTKTAARLKALLAENLLVEDGHDVLIRSWDRWQEALDSESDRRRKDRERKAAERAAKRGQSEDTPAGTVPGLSEDMSVDSPRTVHPESTRKEVEVEVEEEKTKNLSAVADDQREDVEGLCRYFAAALARNDVKATITAKWRTEARLLLDRDERSPAEIRAVIDWATQDGFWRANILSVPKLREKYNTLRLAMQGRGRKPVSDGIASQPDEAYLQPGIFSGRGA